MTVESALLIGPIGTILFMLSKKILIKMEVDDALNQFSIHGICGCWGLIAAGIFDQKKGTLIIGSIETVIIQIIGTGAIIVWCLVPTFFFFMAFRKMSIFRVGEIQEIVGLDYVERESVSLNEFSMTGESSFLFDGVKVRKICRMQRVERLKTRFE